MSKTCFLLGGDERQRWACPEDSVPQVRARPMPPQFSNRKERSQHETDCRLCPVRLVLHIPKGH